MLLFEMGLQKTSLAEKREWSFVKNINFLLTDKLAAVVDLETIISTIALFVFSNH
jgi:hypothetical protein